MTILSTDKAIGNLEALDRAQGRKFGANDILAIQEFHARGIPADDIITNGLSQNVYTYRAWLALGRQVRKGEKSVKLPVWVPSSNDQPKTDTNGKPARRRMFPRTACVFHISQTDSIQNGGA